MEVLFENKTKYSDKVYKIFLKKHEEEYRVSNTMSFWYYLIFFGFCMFMAFRTHEYILGCILLGSLLIYIWYRFIRVAKLVKKTKNGKKITGQFINKYTFYKNYFRIQNPDGKTQMLYFRLYRVIETNEYYYLYITKDLAFIVSKNGFTKGNYMEFSKFLKKKTFAKYKDRKRKNKKED